MSTENDQTTAPNPAAPKVTPPPKAKEPVFDNPQDNIKEEANTALDKVKDKAQAKLHSVEDNFISLSSQRQINLICGALLIIAALTAGLGVLITLVLGTLMIFQALTGNMILNDFIDTMDEKHKRYFVPILFGVIVVIVLAYIVYGFIGAGADS